MDIPQVAEGNIPRSADAAGECLLLDESMICVYLADAQNEERSALRLMLLDLNMNVVGEAADWFTTLAQAKATQLDMLMVDFGLLPAESGTALAELRLACPNAIVIILISHLDARQQSALFAGADAFMSNGEMPECVAERLRNVADLKDIREIISQVKMLMTLSIGGGGVEEEAWQQCDSHLVYKVTVTTNPRR
jgi:DNA-binding NarL/FixJ family response regulator